MRGHHLQSHVTFQYRRHVAKEKRYISFFTSPMDPKLSRVVTYDEGTSPTKSRHIDYVITWQIKNAIYPLSQGLWSPPTKSRDTPVSRSREI